MCAAAQKLIAVDPPYLGGENSRLRFLRTIFVVRFVAKR